MSLTSRCPLSAPAPPRVVIAGVPAPPALTRQPWKRPVRGADRTATDAAPA
jgi:hypothetical protein